MSTPEEIEEEDIASRRRRLAAEISRQRTEFSQAYARLEQPIRYTEYGMRGFGFIRSNPWIIAAVPAAVGIIKTLLLGSPKKTAPRQEQAQSSASSRKTGVTGTISRVAGYGWQLFQLYRRVRSYLP